MLKPLSLVLLTIGALMAVAGIVWFPGDGGYAAGPASQQFVRRVPNVSRDGVPGSTPAPTPTPDHLDIVVRVEMEVQELALVVGGTTQVSVRSEARTEMPGFFGPPRETLADVFVTAHPTDVCSWPAVYADEKIKLTIADSQGILTRGVEITIEGSGWHFDVVCPTNPPHHQRVPAFGEESVPGWLGLTHLGSHSVVIDTPDYSGSPSGSPEGCIKRQGSVQSADPVFGTAKVTVFVVVPGCLGLPPPAPVPTPAAAPSPPVQNPNYDPGGM